MLNFSEQELAFREEVRAFLKEKLPRDLRTKVIEHRRLSKEDHVRWHKSLAAQGWAAPHWPVEHGGTGWTSVQTYIFQNECALAGAPDLMPFGVRMVAPVIIEFGNDQQKKKYLPRIMNCDDWWCQGYSEPGSGSDLASLRTRAEVVGDQFVVNGQKTWTTYGQYADMMFCLVRTDPQAKKQEGISFILIDMKTPGITVRPIITLDGEHEVNEVFFDDVRVPVENLVGELHKGWEYAKFLLRHERFIMTAPARCARELDRVKLVARDQRIEGGTLAADPAFAERVAALEVETRILEYTLLRAIAEAQHGLDVGAKASLIKIRYTELAQHISELMVEVIGPHALPFRPEALEADWVNDVFAPDYAAPLTPYYFNMRKMTILGGSNEIQRNILAKSVLGL
jgi:alkylation response protein AidB-like acyl-CoA dehydrogenase